MGLPLPTPALSSWSEQIGSVLEAEGAFNCTVTFSNPNRASETEYDPDDDEGGETTPEAIASDVMARVQNMALPTEFAQTGQWDAKRTYLVQIPFRFADPAIRKGVMVAVAGGKDPELANLPLVVVGSGNSSHAAIRSIWCSVELGRAA
jgi:hypothetical protein